MDKLSPMLKAETVEDDPKLERLVIDKASFGCFRTKSDGQVVYANDFICRSLGYSRGELLGMTLQDIDLRCGPASWIETWKALKDGRDRTIRTLYQRKDGSHFPVEVTLGHIKFGDKEYCCAYAHDLSALMQTLESLSENEARLQQAIRVAQVGIFDQDHLADTFYWSPEMREIHDRSPDEPVSFDAFVNRVHSDDRENIERAFCHLHDPSGKGSLDVAYRYVFRDGAVRYLHMRAQTFFEGEGDLCHPVRTVGAVRDITARKQSEQEQEKLQVQLLQSRKMEAIGQLAGGVAHDFNNIIQTILGYSEIALELADPEGKLRDYLLEISKTATRSAELVHQLLAFARKQTIKPQVLDLNETVEGLLKMLRRLIGENIELIWKPRQDTWPVKVDPTQVNQILVNLAVNARDAIPGVGMLTIETRNAVIDETYCHSHAICAPGDFVMLMVSDNGVGMDQETLSHLFEPFFTTKELGKGTGLGLATVYGIVKQNNGFVNIYSEPGRGTTFKVYFPRVMAESAVTTLSNTRILIPGTETVLLVEDDAALLELGKDILENQGYTVLTASAPTMALTLLQQHKEHVDLLITDVIMPEMNGRELQQKIQAHFPGIKTLFMSGYTADIIAHHGILEAGIHFLQKPFSIHTLKTKVREVLDEE